MSLPRLVLVGLCALLLIVTGTRWAGADRIDVFDGIEPGERPADGEGLNILLAGSDTRAGLSKQERKRLHVGGDGCDCTDVMMLVHLTADRDRVSVVSIPRDSYLPFAPHREPDQRGGDWVRHHGKVNAAHQHGGPTLTVRTVEQATGVRIHHYAELDFTGLIRAVDGFGGAPVCTRQPLRDSYSGLELAAGSHTLDGLRGLRYVRSRHLGVGVPGDMGRMRRQQHFVARLLTDLADAGALANPLRLRQLAQVVADSATVDDGLTTDRLMRLGWSLRGVRLEDMEFSMVPIDDFDHRVPGWGSSLRWNRAGADALFARVRTDRPITDSRDRPPAVGIDPRTIRVRVHDATGRPAGTGEAADRALREQGFATTGRPLSAAPSARTVIVHGPGQERAAATLGTALSGARLREAGPDEARGPTLHLYLGADHQGVQEIRFDRSEAEGGAVTGDKVACL